MKLEPLAKLVANLKKAGPDIGLIASLELRHRTITRLIAEFAEYADKPGHQGDRRLACRGSSYAPMSWD